MKINHLDLFSGIGGFHLGFEKAGYKLNTFFSEIDKHAIALYKHQFKNSTYVGSVTDVRGADLPRIDLITFGSPCQDFSLAGKRKGMGGERSSLILEAIRLIGECRPRVFVWENVKGTFSSNSGEDFAAILQAFANIGGYRLEWQLLNTSWFLPQNRERIYLVGYSTTTKRNWRGVFPIGEENGKASKIKQTATLTGGQLGRVLDPQGIGYALSACDYKDPMKVEINQIGTKLDSNGGTQPYQQDRVYDADGILPALNQGKSDLIIKHEIGDYRSDEGWRPRKDGNCPTIAARAREDGSGQPLLKIKSATSQGYEEATSGDSINLSQPNSETRRGRVGKQKDQTLETSCNQAVVQAGRMIGRNPDNPKSRKSGLPTEQILEVNDNPNKTNCLTSVQKDNVIVQPVVQPYEDIEIGDIRYDEGGFRPRKDGIAPSLVGSNQGSGTPNCSILKDNTTYRIRRLTPIECERLQGFPDNHTAFGNYDGEVKPMSNTQRYKQCGNAVTVDVVQAVAERCKPLFK